MPPVAIIDNTWLIVLGVTIVSICCPLIVMGLGFIAKTLIELKIGMARLESKISGEITVMLGIHAGQLTDLTSRQTTLAERISRIEAQVPVTNINVGVPKA